MASWLDAKSANRESFVRGQMEVLQGASGRLQSLGLQSVVLHTAMLTDDDSQAIQALLEEILGDPIRSTEGAVQWAL